MHNCRRINNQVGMLFGRSENLNKFILLLIIMPLLSISINLRIISNDLNNLYYMILTAYIWGYINIFIALRNVIKLLTLNSWQYKRLLSQTVIVFSVFISCSGLFYSLILILNQLPNLDKLAYKALVISVGMLSVCMTLISIY
jgi:hypothetical protein